VLLMRRQEPQQHLTAGACFEPTRYICALAKLQCRIRVTATNSYVAMFERNFHCVTELNHNPGGDVRSNQAIAAIQMVAGTGNWPPPRQQFGTTPHAVKALERPLGGPVLAHVTQ